MKNNKISSLKIASTYIGTVVGAGFATGQEVLQFFVAFGFSGLWGILLTTLLFIIFGFIIVELGFMLHSKSHLEILQHSGGKIFVLVMDIIISFFLFGSLTAMIAGTGALFSQQFGIAGIIGNLLMAAITAITVLGGIDGVINSISIVVPFLLLSVIGISMFSITKSPPDLLAAPILETSGLINNWVLSAILYTSYNIVLSVSVLGPLGARAKNKKSLAVGALLGGLGLGIGSLMIYLAMPGYLPGIKDFEVPMAYIAGNISPIVQIIFAVILIAEVYTTAVASLYGVTARVTTTEKAPKIVVIGIAVAAFFASMVGFSNLVKYLYPLVGYSGILLLLTLLYGRIKTRFFKNKNP